MKKLPDLDTRIDHLSNIINGYTETKLLVTAIELKIFDCLSTPQSAETLASRLKTHPVYTRYLLDGLAALSLLDKKNGCYSNQPDTQAVLHSQSPAYQGKGFSMMHKMSETVLGDMGHIVRFGPRENPVDISDFQHIDGMCLPWEYGAGKHQNYVLLSGAWRTLQSKKDQGLPMPFMRIRYGYAGIKTGYAPPGQCAATAAVDPETGKP
ncbi:methyltransferase dimerization domain-containing protein [Desulfobacter postgatei]|jgi:hypothetical protein|uniref:methyltransferase family protein n=1 Tax=Desulfobacter postgatei TaxID=2293 RepID=UPI002A36DFB0|nr:methyltransferase dimerization domain-containing protein [Desulfobacter postgatei]MDX9963966.1 methyltransferase dimerization domain-containing protein [Desulfobacter postgatei]